jgi:hypothetical protein
MKGVKLIPAKTFADVLKHSLKDSARKNEIIKELKATRKGREGQRIAECQMKMSAPKAKKAIKAAKSPNAKRKTKRRQKVSRKRSKKTAKKQRRSLEDFGEEIARR